MIKPKTLKPNFKGFYFFVWELDLLRKVGFKFRGLKIRAKIILDGVEFNTYQVLQDPHPIRLTSARLEILRELPYKMNAIKIRIK